MLLGEHARSPGKVRQKGETDSRAKSRPAAMHESEFPFELRGDTSGRAYGWLGLVSRTAPAGGGELFCQSLGAEQVATANGCGPGLPFRD